MHRHTAAKLQRWSLLLMAFDYKIHFIDGETNVWADLLSRWGANMEEKQTIPVKKLLLMPVSPTISDKFKWPTLENIKVSQQK